MRDLRSLLLVCGALAGCEAYNRELYGVYTADSAMQAMDVRDVTDAAFDVPTHDTANDTHQDDVTADAPIDTAPDVGMDVAVDARIDAATDTTVDVPRDVRTDATDTTPCTPRVVLNEICALDSTGDSYDEFVELYNASDCEARIEGWRIVSRAYASEPAAIVWAALVGEIIPPHGFFVIGGMTYRGPVQEHFSGSTSGGSSAIANTGGVGLMDAAGLPIDSVAYNVTTGSLIEGAPFALPAAGGYSLVRRPDGHDTDHNDVDWLRVTTTTPGGPN